MIHEANAACADVTFADVVQDYAKRAGMSQQQVRDAFIYSGAYDELYDEETGLWGMGPDYCIDFFERLMEARKQPGLYEEQSPSVE